MRPRFALHTLAALVLAGSALLFIGPPEAEAKSSFDSAYTLGQTFNAALRYVRVDLALNVTEKDPGVAYILFEYKSTETGQRVVPGSIQMLEAGRSVKVVVELKQMPRYHEQVLGDALAKKLRDEYGEPPPPRATKDLDAGAEGGPTSVP